MGFSSPVFMRYIGPISDGVRSGMKSTSKGVMNKRVEALLQLVMGCSSPVFMRYIGPSSDGVRSGMKSTSKGVTIRGVEALLQVVMGHSSPVFMRNIGPIRDRVRSGMKCTSEGVMNNDGAIDCGGSPMDLSGAPNRCRRPSSPQRGILDPRRSHHL